MSSFIQSHLGTHTRLLLLLNLGSLHTPHSMFDTGTLEPLTQSRALHADHATHLGTYLVLVERVFEYFVS